jgi:GntR family transcriptional repressor for pyruvate dehydrogenase complex
MLKTPRRQSLVEEVTQNLLQRLASGVLQPGDRMPTEKELSAELGVGRSSIREAMRTLEMLNVIEIRHGIGTFVTMVQPSLLVNPKHLRHVVDRQGLLDLLELRKIVEVESAALAAKRATAAEIQILREDVRALEKGVMEGRRPPEDMGFHLNIAQATHNPRFAEISRWIVAFYELDPDIPNEKDVQAHDRICEAIAMGDEEAARRAMREHLEEIESRFWIPQGDGHADGSER